MFTCIGKAMNDIKVMGILNVNKDSFYKRSRFDGKEALLHVEGMIKDGAVIIDIGAVSSRPGSKSVSDEEEIRRIKPIVDAIYKKKLYKKVEFSLDSYSPLCVEYALKNGFKIINDITSLENDEVAKLVAKYDATIVLMHKKGNTEDMQKNPIYKDIVLEVNDFFKQRIKKAKSFGINKIILDVGIGFGKNLKHNLTLIKNHASFLHFGYPMLLGASRKSMINMISKSEVQNRLCGTLVIHLKAIENGASIIRVHDVAEHVQALEVLKCLNEVT